MGKIGILGGTFDPIHNGHLLLGKQAYLEYDLDCVWYMPSGQPPHKKERKVTEALDRCAMVQAAIADEPCFDYSDFETSREGNSYTAKTLTLLREYYPEHEFYFIIGADSLYEIESWYHPEEVIEGVTILVAVREYEDNHLPMEQQMKYLTEKYNGRIYRLHSQEVNISSEEIRGMAARNQPIHQYVPAAVVRYIKTHHLYQEEEHYG